MKGAPTNNHNHRHKTAAEQAACKICAAASKATAVRPGSRGGGKSEVDQLRTQITDLVGRDPSKAAKILTDWVNGASQSKKSGKKAA